jgi:hypothetical protein
VIRVVSTAYAPPPEARAKSLASTAGAHHVYIDAAEQDPPRSHFENFRGAVSLARPDDIIVCLDGDDWLMPGALARVQRAYDAGAEVTYGSYVFADGRPGHARAMTPDELAHPRRSPWVASHLKTFRAGLLERVPIRCFQQDGWWLEHARDMALMFALLEVADHPVYIPEILYVYNYATSTEHNATAEVLEAEREQAAYVRGMKPCST